MSVFYAVRSGLSILFGLYGIYQKLIAVEHKQLVIRNIILKQRIILNPVRLRFLVLEGESR